MKTLITKIKVYYKMKKDTKRYILSFFLLCFVWFNSALLCYAQPWEPPPCDAKNPYVSDLTPLSTPIATAASITTNARQLNCEPSTTTAINNIFTSVKGGSSANYTRYSITGNTTNTGYVGYGVPSSGTYFLLEFYTIEHHNVTSQLAFPSSGLNLPFQHIYGDSDAKIKWGLTHYWRWIGLANSSNPGYVGDTVYACPWFYFTTIFAPPLLNESPVNPSATPNNGTTSLPAFQVNYNRAVTKYIIELNTSSTFANTPITYTYTGDFAADENPVLNFPTCGLSNSTTYYVRIKALPDYSKCKYDDNLPLNIAELNEETLWSWDNGGTPKYVHSTLPNIFSDYINTQEFSFTYSAGSIVAATDMSDFPANAVVNTPLSLTATITPSTASYQHIIWHLVDAGTTGATISGDILLQLQPVQQK